MKSEGDKEPQYAISRAWLDTLFALEMDVERPVSSRAYLQY